MQFYTRDTSTQFYTRDMAVQFYTRDMADVLPEKIKPMYPRNMAG